MTDVEREQGPKCDRCAQMHEHRKFWRLRAWRLEEALESISGEVNAAMADRNSDVVDWVRGWDTGISSLTIWSVLSGLYSDTAARCGYSVPLDPADFGRCHRLLKRFPEWRGRIGEVAQRHPHWRALIENWDALEALYEQEAPSGRCPRLYERMKQLEAASRGRATTEAA